MDWLLIGLAFAFVGIAIWLWRSAQPRLVNLGYIPIWLKRWAQFYRPTGKMPVSLPPTMPAAPSPPPPTVPQPPPAIAPSVRPPRQPTMPMGVPPEPVGWLVLRSGPRTGQQFGLKRGRNTVGRDSRWADIVLDDGTVSAEHARIQFEHGQFYVYDLASTSGTYVNNRNIGRAKLIDGDCIQIGQTVLIFMRVDGCAAYESKASRYKPLDVRNKEPNDRQPRRFRHQIPVTGKVPTRMYEQDSCALQLRLLPSRLEGLAVQDSKVISFTSDREEPRVEVELQAVGFEVAGNTAQAHVWDGKQSHQCLWNISPRRGGSFEIGLVFRAQTYKVMEQVDALVYPISVRKYAGLSKRQVQFLAGTLSAAGTLLGLAEVLRRLGVF